MASAKKPAKKAWAWSAHPAAVRPMPPNLLIDASTVRRGRDTRLPKEYGHDRAEKYVIPGSEKESGGTDELYYRPTADEIEVVKSLLDGEPGDPDWGLLIGMLIFSSSLSISDVRRMRCNEIVEVLAKGEPERLRKDMAGRKRVGEEQIRQVVAVAEGAVESMRRFERRVPRIQDALAGLTPLQVDDAREPPVPKPDGWSRGDLCEQAKEYCSLGDSTFDRIRAAAGLKPGPHRSQGRPRRYSRDDLTRLIAAALSGKFHHGKSVANAWGQLLGE